MATKTDILYQITELSQMHDDFISYNDSINFTDENQKVYVTTDSLLSNTKVSSETAIQALIIEKQNSLIEYVYIVKNDTTLLNICFDVGLNMTEENIESLIDANDLQAFNRTDIDPNEPIIKRGTEIIYYK